MSSYFYKLFLGGMSETWGDDVNILIDKREETPFLQMLDFVMTNVLPSSMEHLLELIITSDKFDVMACVESSVSSLLLMNTPITHEVMVRFFGIPCATKLNAGIKSLLDAARDFVVQTYFNVEEYYNIILEELPLDGVVALLSSYNLVVTCEDQVYSLVLEWVRRHFLEPEERRRIWRDHFINLVHFHKMSPHRLEQVSKCEDIENANGLVYNAFRYKSLPLCHKRMLLYPDRMYQWKPVIVTELARPFLQSLIHFSITKLDVTALEFLPFVCSESFYAGDGQQFYMSVFKNESQFCVSLNHIKPDESLADQCTLDYKLDFRRLPNGNFGRRRFSGRIVFNNQQRTHILFETSYIDFLSDEVFFINDEVHLRIELTAH